MATLVLSTVGNALGGPIGGAIGSLIGRSIDQSLFGPGPRRGPRLNDLGVQSSSYGTQVPRIYGTMRAAGSVIWATDLKESSEPQGGAKGQPETIVYSYSASFAVALSSRAARGVGRIWADGKLLRGVAGDFKVKTGFRFYPGDEDQPIDALIASVEGIDRTPAFRGLALAVFEDLQLAEFGNRIPFLTFEVIGDQADPTLGDILRDASGGAVDATAPEIVRGYAAYGPSRHSAIEPLIEQFAVPLFDDGDRIRSTLPDLRQLHPDEVGCGAGVDPSPKSERLQAPVRTLPRSLALSYYDPTRDYQTGQMRATGATSAGIDEAVELPVVMDAAQAKGLAQSHIARRWAQRDRLVLRLPPCQLAVEPGQMVALDDGSAWRVEQATVEEWVVKLELSPAWQAVGATPADGGAHLPATDLVASPTEMAVLDLPDLGVGRHDVPAIHVAACQPSADWRAVPIEIAVSGEVRTVSSARSEAVIGAALTVLSTGQSAIFDLVNTVDVELFDPEHWLESRDDDALANGANLASLGPELIQFGVATPIGGRRFRLSKLLRGRRGTEWAMDGHAPQERFTLLSANSLQRIELPMEALGSAIGVTARGLADGNATPASLTVRGEALRPPSPVHLLAARTPSGDLHATWIRRSRVGWSWLDGTDVALGEIAERYRVRVEGGAGSITTDATVPEALIANGALASLGPGPLTVLVVQVGDYGESHPASIIIS